jgi:DNA-binding FadR family transcriptional regulator
MILAPISTSWSRKVASDHRALPDAIERRDPDEAQRIRRENRQKNAACSSSCSSATA